MIQNDRFIEPTRPAYAACAEWALFCFAFVKLRSSCGLGGVLGRLRAIRTVSPSSSGLGAFAAMPKIPPLVPSLALP
jgi:hypothetical protein